MQTTPHAQRAVDMLDTRACTRPQMFCNYIGHYILVGLSVGDIIPLTHKKKGHEYISNNSYS